MLTKSCFLYLFHHQVIENIEVVANVDDGIEWFGGTANAKNLLVWGQGDDGLDIDQAFVVGQVWDLGLVMD